MNRRTWMTSLAALTLAAGVLAVRMPTLDAQAAADPQKTVDAAYAKFKTLAEGKNADYIPALAKVDPNLFGIALVTGPSMNSRVAS